MNTPKNTSQKPFLPYGRQLIDADDLEAVRQVLSGDWLTTGPAVAEFEAAFAAKVEAKYAVACSSGTAALHLAAHALGIASGDTVLVPSLTFLATANAQRYMGADVAFCDSDPDSGLISVSSIEQTLDQQSNARAIFPVHLNGQCADMEAISAIAKQNHLVVVEDACHTLGAHYSTQASDHLAPVGSCRWSDATVFSFHPVKTITMGEGGMVTTNDGATYEKMIQLRSHGMIRDAEQFRLTKLAFDANGAANPWYYEMHDLGYNYRASDINCALGLSQLSKLDRFIETRMQLAAQYEQQLDDLAPIVKVVKREPHSTPAWHLFVILIDFKRLSISRQQLVLRLASAGIGTQVHYLPVHLQPYYHQLYGEAYLPGAVSYYDRCLSLPLHPNMTGEDVKRIVSELKTILNTSVSD